MKPRQKLIWLGLKRPSKNQSSISETVGELKKHVGDYDTFQDGVSNQSGYSGFKTYLKNQGFTQQQADDFVSKAQDTFSDTDGSGTTWDEFQDYVVNKTDSYQGLKSKFPNTSTLTSELETDEGVPAAGLRVFENSGVTKDGVSAPAGAVEVFGQEVHFSQTGTTKSKTGSGSTGSDPTFTVSNISTDDDDDIVLPGQSVTISADVTNNGDYQEFFVASLLEDDTAIDNKSFTISSGSTKSVSFTVSKDEYVCHDYKINSSSAVKVCWTPRQL